MGPQHPSTHGVLRVILKLDGEKVLGTECVIGYLHRGVEKIGENRTYAMFNPYVDRMDYVAAVSNGLGYCEAVEKLLNAEARRPPPTPAGLLDPAARRAHARVAAAQREGPASSTTTRTMRPPIRNHKVTSKKPCRTWPVITLSAARLAGLAAAVRSDSSQYMTRRTTIRASMPAIVSCSSVRRRRGEAHSAAMNTSGVRISSKSTMRLKARYACWAPVSEEAGNSVICPQVGGSGCPIAAAIFWQSAAGEMAPAVMAGR